MTKQKWTCSHCGKTNPNEIFRCDCEIGINPNAVTGHALDLVSIAAVCTKKETTR